MTTAAIYCRISHDDEGEGAGVERQRKDCKTHELDVVGTFTDNDVSASRYARRKRPEYRKLIDAASNGVGVIVAYHIDRLYRQPRELEELIDLAQDGTVEVHTLNGPLDLRTGDGRAMARVLVAMAAKSPDDDSRRWKALKAHRAENGLPAGGARAFGYDEKGTTIRKGEAALLRKAAKDVLAGESLTGIARRWNERGVKPPLSKKGTWTATQVRSVLTSPRHAGLRVHQGEVVGSGTWEAIIDPETHQRLLALLNDPARRRAQPSRRSLFTGLVVCGTCGATMTRDKSRGRNVLRCRKGPGLPGCGSVSILADETEALVVDAMLDRLDGPALAELRAKRAADSEAGALVREVEALDQRLADVDAMFAAGEIDRAQRLRIDRQVKDQLGTARRKLRTMEHGDALDTLTGAPVRQRWAKLSEDRKRAILVALIERVVIAPATERRRFDSARIDVRWKA